MPLFSPSFPLEVFLVSSFIFSCGLLAEIWRKAVRLDDFSQMSLQYVERNHPHIPSLKIIGGMVLCAAVLTLVSVGMTGSWGHVQATGQSIEIVALLIDICALGILLEMRCNNTRDVAFGFVLGTTLSFAFEMLREQMYRDHPVTVIMLILLLATGLIVSWRFFFHAWSQTVRFFAAFSCIVWLGLFLVMH